VPPASPPSAPARPAATAPLEQQTPTAPVARPIREIRLKSETLSLVVAEPGEHLMGRSADVPLRVDHPTVSRRHAAVILSDDRKVAYLRHEGGINGTLLNGKRVEKLTPLADGDVVRIGDVELRAAVTRG